MLDNDGIFSALYSEKATITNFYSWFSKQNAMLVPEFLKLPINQIHAFFA